MSQYKLLTPGPLTTTKTVKEQMFNDRCTWDEEYLLTQFQQLPPLILLF